MKNKMNNDMQKLKVKYDQWQEQSPLPNPLKINEGCSGKSGILLVEMNNPNKNTFGEVSITEQYHSTICLTAEGVEALRVWLNQLYDGAKI